jgi:hypothetical protein
MQLGYVRACTSVADSSSPCRIAPVMCSSAQRLDRPITKHSKDVGPRSDSDHFVARRRLRGIRFAERAGPALHAESDGQSRRWRWRWRWRWHRSEEGVPSLQNVGECQSLCTRRLQTARRCGCGRTRSGGRSETVRLAERPGSRWVVRCDCHRFGGPVLCDGHRMRRCRPQTQ